MEFKVVSGNYDIPDEGVDTIYLGIDRWNDFSFVTQFYMTLYDDKGNYHDIGSIKIGFKGQTTDISTHIELERCFEKLNSNFFSLGSGLDFYKRISCIGSYGQRILASINDIALTPDIIDQIRGEEVFGTSLLRDVSLSAVKGQYARVLSGGADLTNYQFKYIRPGSDYFGEISVNFDVTVGSMPSTNIHAVIGRNGVGKTTLLNGMIDAITKPKKSEGKFVDLSNSFQQKDIDESYFSSLVSVSFSAFDPFIPPPEQPDPAKGTCYFYIGLKDPKNEGFHRDIDSLQADSVRALTHCFSDVTKAKRWNDAIEKLGSDENFSSMKLARLEEAFHALKKEVHSQSDSDDFKSKYAALVKPFLNKMSSGHAIVLLTITRLVATVEEKTLVLLDEPESHLHPPLLSAFIRALSELLLNRNGVAIIATHSPVVLQEVPKSCVWKVYRQGIDVICDRPSIETFAENAGVLTSEVFNLEVERSGFHEVLKKSVLTGRSYKEILMDFKGQLGFEGRAILKAMVVDRDKEF